MQHAQPEHSLPPWGQRGIYSSIHLDGERFSSAEMFTVAFIDMSLSYQKIQTF